IRRRRAAFAYHGSAALVGFGCLYIQYASQRPPRRSLQWKRGCQPATRVPLGVRGKRYSAARPVELVPGGVCAGRLVYYEIAHAEFGYALGDGYSKFSVSDYVIDQSSCTNA